MKDLIVAFFLLTECTQHLWACTPRLVCDESVSGNLKVNFPSQCRRVCVPNELTGPLAPLNLDVTRIDLNVATSPRVLFKVPVVFTTFIPTFMERYSPVLPNATLLYVSEPIPPSAIEEYSNPDYADVLLSLAEAFMSPSNITDPLLISNFVLRDAFLQADGDTLSVWRDVSDLWKEAGIDTYNPIFTQRCTFPNRKVCIPIAMSAESFLMYRKSVFNSYNLTFPATWEELLTVCEVLKKNGKTCLSTSNYKYATNTFEGPWKYVDIILRRVLSVEKHAQLASGLLSWEDPEVLFGLDKFAELCRRGYLGFHEPSAFIKSFGQLATLLADILFHFGVTNENAMVLGSTENDNIIRFIAPHDTVEYGAFPEIMPIGQRPQRNEVMNLYAINSRNHHVDPYPGASAEFRNVIKELLKPEYQSLMSSSGYIPMNTSYTQGSAVYQTVDTLGNFTIKPWLSAAFTPFMTRFQLTTNSLLEGNISVQQAGKAMNEARALYLLKTTPQPMISPFGGTYEKGIQVIITASPGSTIFYTLDGTTPSDGSNIYTGPILLSTTGDVTIKARAAQGVLKLSPTASQTYKVTSATAVMMGALIGVFSALLALAVIATVVFFATRGWRTRRQALRRAPKGTVTIMFADVEGSTELWSTLGAVMHTAIAQMFAVMRKNLRELRGYEVKTQGDAMMAAFTNWRDALDWCITVQHALMDVDWPEGVLLHPKSTIETREGKTVFRGLRLRMGIHEGTNLDQEYDSVSSRVDYFGPDVNYAARIGSVGCGGQIVTSDSIAKFHDETVLIGEYPLKGIPGLHRVHEVRHSMLAERTFINPSPSEKPTETTHSPALGLASESRCGVCFRPCKSCNKDHPRKGQQAQDAYQSFRHSSEASSGVRLEP